MEARSHTTIYVDKIAEMPTVCEPGRCAGCMACLEVCPKNAITIVKNVKEYNALIDKKRCVNCNACHERCQVNNQPILQAPKVWKQGWSLEVQHRKGSSSGGLAYEIEMGFIQSGGHVWSCAFVDGEFRFVHTCKSEDLDKFQGSKYIKSNPYGIYKKIKKQIKQERVLFVGLPCQVAALINFVGDEKDNLYTIDLVCHGSPAPELLDQFLSQYHQSLKTISNISFRTKTNFQLANNEISFSTPGTRDCYTMAFLEGLCYTENCYQCPYARIERVSDITIGDSWGSELPEDEQGKGISLVLVQTDKGKELLDNSSLQLFPVDLEKAKKANHQLISPSKAPEKRNLFFQLITNGRSFNYAVMRCLPSLWSKQRIKGILIKAKLLRGGYRISYELRVVPK